MVVVRELVSGERVEVPRAEIAAWLRMRKDEPPS
jgi:hypothetical protein